MSRCRVGFCRVSVIFSPMPRANTVPRLMQKGTSAPIFAPSAISSFSSVPASNISERIVRTAAASALAPPSPASEGIFLISSISKSQSTTRTPSFESASGYAAAKSSAARYAVFLGCGRAKSALCLPSFAKTEILPLPFTARRVTISNISIDCMTVSSS